jgi:hypothetical protein
MPKCVRCEKTELGEEVAKSKGWYIIKGIGDKNLTVEEFAYWIPGLCPECQMWKDYEVILSKETTSKVWARNTKEMLEIIKNEFPDHRIVGFKLAGDNWTGRT